MKYYDEKQMDGIRRTLENELLKWPGVTSREMMGCLCYFRENKFFAWLVTNGIVLTKLPAKEKAVLSKQVGGKPFEMGGKPSRLWEFPLKDQTSVKTLLPFVKKSYEAAKAKE